MTYLNKPYFPGCLSDVYENGQILRSGRTEWSLASHYLGFSEPLSAFKATLTETAASNQALTL